MREVYLQIVEMLPEHRLANNLLNWVAWSYCYEANLPEISDEQYYENYRKALNTYERIAREYPDGLTGKNARENIGTIQQKLASDDRLPVDPDRWRWYQP
jgi:hypothetical protein